MLPTAMRRGDAGRTRPNAPESLCRAGKREDSTQATVRAGPGRPERPDIGRSAGTVRRTAQGLYTWTTGSLEMWVMAASEWCYMLIRPVPRS